MTKLLGVDIGSTTVKATVIDNGKITYSSYVRHRSFVKETVIKELKNVALQGDDFCVAFTGSAGMGFAQRHKIPFVQEVQAAYVAIRKYYPQADVAVELGGEDAKIIFVTGGAEQRMNGTCAGGTGAFIDQMATLLNLSNEQMDEYALKATQTYPIASRCGVFAKSDVQPLINQGAKKEDVSASIFQAVVDQTVSGLAQGRRIKGNVLFLGGPLYFFKSLQNAFKKTLNLNDESALFPAEAPRFMSIGAALYAQSVEPQNINELIKKIENVSTGGVAIKGKPLFSSQKEYDEFVARHARADVKKADLTSYSGKCFIGIDSGSTTTKLAAITPDGELLWSHYQENDGQPLEVVLGKLKEFYSLCGDGVKVDGCAVTGYGEDLIKSAVKADFGIVETVAHFKAATFFCPDADFIIDIGGQDMKCFKIKNGAIESIMLNEACSSGCGSFLQTFAKAMGMSVDEFSKKGLFAPSPVELGSRCTVFMNSSVKQAQKEGASISDISAGLSLSVVKNAIYKVIHCAPDELGEHVVVQGGTFLNDAVLRAFENETGKEVIRPSIAGLMGAFGAALYAKENAKEKTSVLTKSELDALTYSTKSVQCRGCANNCNVNVVAFSDGERYVSGNKCEKGAGLKQSESGLDLYAYKQKRLLQFDGAQKAGAVSVGLPVQLLMYEQLPLWRGFFESLGFNVVLSEPSSRSLYFKGQHTIASDTVCYPAKLMHGAVESLLDKKVDFIFYPCQSYNLDEKASDNHYNCPVVAYYAELLKANNERLNDKNFIMPYVDLNLPSAANILFGALKKYGVTLRNVKKALKYGFMQLSKYHDDVLSETQRIIAQATEQGKQIIVLAGRPYHADAEINHGINKLLTSLGVAVLSEDGVFALSDGVKVNVLNQWTYHSRLYRAADYVARHKNMNLVQLVSFGCGLDAVTTDEVRSIMEKNGKLYTQIKIDEINNLGVVKIRLRSLLAAIGEKTQ